VIIISSFKLECNKETGIFTIFSSSTHKCPLCGGFLSYRDRRCRNVINIYGESRCFSLRRLRCEVCEKLHIEIPDIIQPFKHYDSEAVQNVIDETELSKNCVADNSTISRWKASFAKATPEIEQRLVSVQARETDDNVPLLSPRLTLVYIRATIGRWLAFVMQLLINSGHKLCTLFAFRPLHYSATIQNAGNDNSGGSTKYDKTFKETG
jgi:predicted RNA-binding Zn-ribbon protein involved in translation (DUF1610 family)